MTLGPIQRPMIWAGSRGLGGVRAHATIAVTQIRVALLPPRTCISSRPRLLLKVMSGSVAL